MFCFLLLSTNIQGLYLFGENALKSARYLGLHFTELLTGTCCHSVVQREITWAWCCDICFTKAYFAIQCRLFIPSNYVKSIHLVLSWFSELLNTVIFSLKLKRMICFRYLPKYGQIGTVEWTAVSFLLRFCFLQLKSGSCWLSSAVLEEDLNSDQFPNYIL